MQTESTSRRVPLSDIVAELNTQLRLSEFAGDPSNNGLQVEGAPRGVAKICFGVDASPEFYEAALAHGADLLVVHHGISWGPSLARIAGSNYALVAPLIKADAALYAAHLPLDAHPTLGNNAGLARALGLQELQPFAQYHGYTIGMKGRFSEPIEWSAVLARLRAVCLDGDFRTFGPSEGRVQTLGVVSGGGADMFSHAVDEGLDAFVTGELHLQDYTALQTRPIRFASAGHYATERFGVQALARHLAAHFGVDCEFIDLHLPY